MKKIGLIGGIGPESTLDYYRRIIYAARQRSGGLAVPEIIIYSADLQEALAIMESKRPGLLADWLLIKLDALHAAGADFAAITANTAHLVFDEVAKRSPLPLISIVEATCTAAQQQGLQRIGLLGTRFTMQADFFQQPFSRQGMEVVVPLPEEQDLIHERLFSEIELGIIKDATRDELLAIVQRMVEQERIEALILGCTELPLILPDQAHGIPLLNTVAIHVASIVAKAAEGT